MNTDLPTALPPLPDKPSFHAHETPRGAQVWAFVRRVPHRITFRGTLPYQGFDYEDADGHRQETKDDAYFSATKENLIDSKVEKKRREIAEIEAEISLLEAMKANEGLVEAQTAYDRAEHKLAQCFAESPEYYAAWDERQTVGAALNAALGKKPDAMIW